MQGKLPTAKALYHKLGFGNQKMVVWRLADPTWIISETETQGPKKDSAKSAKTETKGPKKDSAKSVKKTDHLKSQRA